MKRAYLNVNPCVFFFFLVWSEHEERRTIEVKREIIGVNKCNVNTYVNVKHLLHVSLRE